MARRWQVFGVCLLVLCVTALSTGAADEDGTGEFITLASTTSTRDSGLLDALLPRFGESSGIDVRVVAVGTGQAFRLARNGDADALLVHDRGAEEQFVADGYGLDRRDVMSNDFVVVGPPTDPAAIRSAADAPDALRRIAQTRSPFASRGDDSGTHHAELRLWTAAELDPASASGSWYRELGSGMGATLNAAVAMGAYTLVDRATWTAFANRQQTEILFEGDPRLANPYSVLLVNPERHPHVKVEAARRFAQWLTSPEGQAQIAGYHVNGTQLFRPAAR